LFEYHSFEKRNIFERTEFERTYETCLYLHKRFFSKRILKERQTNFERTLFDQTTYPKIISKLKKRNIHKKWLSYNNYWPFISIVTNKLKYEYFLLKSKVLLIYIKTNFFFQFNFDFFDFVMKNLIFAVNWITKRSHKRSERTCWIESCIANSLKPDIKTGTNVDTRWRSFYILQ
jgi:hypothetical protein